MKDLNPDFKPPSRPFKRLDYKDAIAYLNKENILFQDDDPTVPPRHHQVGDDIAEAAERKMTDQMGVPIFLMNFPKDLKAFYMKKIPGDENFTESVDVLMPGVGEIVGGSMRIPGIEELMEGYKREGIPAEPYYWFTDQRKYGTCEHGGYGLGVEVSQSHRANRLIFLIVRHCLPTDTNILPKFPCSSPSLCDLTAIHCLAHQPMDRQRVSVVPSMAWPRRPVSALRYATLPSLLCVPIMT